MFKAGGISTYPQSFTVDLGVNRNVRVPQNTGLRTVKFGTQVLVASDPRIRTLDIYITYVLYTAQHGKTVHDRKRTLQCERLSLRASRDLVWVAVGSGVW